MHAKQCVETIQGATRVLQSYDRIGERRRIGLVGDRFDLRLGDFDSLLKRVDELVRTHEVPRGNAAVGAGPRAQHVGSRRHGNWLTLLSQNSTSQDG